MKGYQLTAALRAVADDIATDSRAQLVRYAAAEIESLIQQNRRLLEACDDLVAHVDGCQHSWESDGSPRGTKEHGLAVCLNNRAGDMIKSAIASAK